MPDYYRMGACAAAEALTANLEMGLTEEEAAARLAQYGPNELLKQSGPTIWQKLVAQLKNFLIVLLLMAAAISLLLGEGSDAIVIFFVILLNTVLGIVQELKAEKALAALESLSAPTAKVYREGKTREVPASQLVPGDLILFNAGAFIPADGRLVTAENLQVNEAALTGESAPV